MCSGLYINESFESMNPESVIQPTPGSSMSKQRSINAAIQVQPSSKNQFESFQVRSEMVHGRHG
jgi:hypothetical protein